MDEVQAAVADTVYERFIAEVEALTIRTDMSAVAVVGELTRAVKRAQNAWDEADGEANPAMCACGHGLHVHDAEGDPCLCEVCGDNTRCDYAEPETIAADRWDEGWHAAVIALCPHKPGDPERLLWAVMDHPPKGNPYRTPGPTAMSPDRLETYRAEDGWRWLA